MTDYTIVNCKNLAVTYTFEDGDQYGTIFIVESKDASDIIIEIIDALDQYKLTSWGVHTGEEYQNIKSNCAQKGTIGEYLTNEMNRLIQKKLLR